VAGLEDALRMARRPAQPAERPEEPVRAAPGGKDEIPEPALPAVKDWPQVELGAMRKRRLGSG